MSAAPNLHYTESSPVLPHNPIIDILTSHEPPVQWLVPDLLPRGYLVTLVGEAGAGKSVLSYIISLGLASGHPVIGRKCPSIVTVLYFDQENSRPDRDEYLRWAWHGMGRPSTDLIQRHLWSVHFGIGGKDWVAKAAEWVTTVQPALIVFDTATPCCGIIDENDNAEAAKVINQIRALQQLVVPTATALVLKHARVVAEGQSYDIRGAKTWKSAADSVIFHIRHKGRPRADGLADTHLEPAKSRAFGLRTTMHLTPSWVDGHKGLKLEQGEG